MTDGVWVDERLHDFRMVRINPKDLCDHNDDTYKGQHCAQKRLLQKNYTKKPLQNGRKSFDIVGSATAFLSKVY